MTIHPECAQMVDRDIALERSIIELAAKAAGVTDDRGLRSFADWRAHPGGVRADLDSDRETAEEIADASSYVIWGMVPLHASYLAGDADATRAYERRLRALSHLVAAWHALHDRR